MSVHVYVGPTIPQAEVRQRLPVAELHPPVAHGDLLRIRPCRGDVVLIIDGDFHDRLPVRNQEILMLLQEGIQVVGAAGMGALRAAELRTYGMIGIGTVFEMYRDGTVDGDDEVAVRYGGGNVGYEPRAESLINMRCLLRAAVDEGAMSAAESARVSQVAESVRLFDRSWTLVEARLASASTDGTEDLLRRLRDLVRADGKGTQFRDALQALDFVAGPELAAPTPTEDPDLVERVPVTPYVRTWVDQNRIRVVDGESVDDVSVLRFLQLYDPAFPARWALYAMGVIADGSPRTHPVADDVRRQLEDSCSARAVERLGGTLLEKSVQQYWLAGSELSLPERDKLLRVLVRSYRAPGGAPIHGCPRLFTRPAALWSKASDRVAQCRKENRRVAELSPRYSVQRLKRERVLGHFARTWGVENARDALLAAARDRAITSLDQLHTYGREMMLPFLDWDAEDVARALSPT
ncbi:TfuA-like protein [Plantactinospora sp. B24E8]|uniref:TfuA-like protein n=1 Tax=Plantactinospora sp. B24E8 TaxID=3153567 RepID=UPI00325D55F2